MKKVAVIFLLLMISLFTYAQKPHVEWGIKGGLNVSSLTYAQTPDFAFRVSFYAGVLVNLRFTAKSSIQPELFFSGQGARHIVTGAKDNFYNLNYINIPFLFQYLLDGGFRLQTGPQVGILISAKSKENSGVRDIKSNYEDVDFSWSFGASYKSKSGFGCDARANSGLINFSLLRPDIYNNVYQFGVFYQFTHDGKRIIDHSW
jgi:hypothetical protein